MRFHFATIPLYGSAEAEHALNVFLASYRVLNVERHLIAAGAQSVWAICVAYVDASSPVAVGAGLGRGSPGRKERTDDREVLDEAAFARFAKLRAWRKSAAECGGVPPYAVFTREQLAEIVRGLVQCLRDDNLGFRLAGAQTQIYATCNGSAPDQTAVASGGSVCRRTPRGLRRASSGSGCAIERSPGLRLPGSRMERW